MVEATLVKYIQRRLNSGHNLHEIKGQLKQTGYKEDIVEEALEAIGDTKVIHERVLPLNPKALPTPTSKIRKLLKQYYKLIVIGGVLLFAGLILALVNRVNFGTVNWPNALIVGAVYVAAFAILVSIQSLLVYSLHRASQAHSPIHLRMLPIFSSAIIGQAFTFSIYKILPEAPLFVSVLLGSIIFVVFLFVHFYSKGSEIISSTIIYYALTYFFYILVIEIYTYSRVLLLFGIVV